MLERLADAQFGAGRIETARQNAQAALKIDPQRLAAKRTIAKIAMQERDYATALPYLQELAARNPQDVTMRIELARPVPRLAPPTKHGGILRLHWRSGYPDEKGSLHYLLGTDPQENGTHRRGRPSLCRCDATVGSIPAEILSRPGF